MLFMAKAFVAMSLISAILMLIGVMISLIVSMYRRYQKDKDLESFLLNVTMPIVMFLPISFLIYAIIPFFQQ